MAENIGDGSVGEEVPQPTEFAFDAQSESEIEAAVAKYPPGRQASAVISALYTAQKSR